MTIFNFFIVEIGEFIRDQSQFFAPQRARGYIASYIFISGQSVNKEKNTCFLAKCATILRWRSEL
ncbi:hypothetical protein Hdeb2414_s0004g00126681 [Helianthus debilis subsp. tardiflorus]